MKSSILCQLLIVGSCFAGVVDDVEQASARGDTQASYGILKKYFNGASRSEATDKEIIERLVGAGRGELLAALLRTPHNRQVLEKLLKNPAIKELLSKVGASGSFTYSPFKLLAGSDLSAQDKIAYTKILVDNGISLNRNEYWGSPLKIAIAIDPFNYVDVNYIKFLLKNGATLASRERDEIYDFLYYRINDKYLTPSLKQRYREIQRLIFKKK